MAEHIASVAGSAIAKVSKDELYARMLPGDLIFCSGTAGISVAIERETNSAFSHVLMAWLPGPTMRWLTLEATIHRGVHVGVIRDYVDGYEGDLVLARRPALTQIDITAEINAGLALLDDGYNWQSEVTFAAHKLLRVLPVANPQKEFYCSGLQQVMSQVSSVPIVTTGAILATPEQLWTDASVTPVCALLRAA